MSDQANVLRDLMERRQERPPAVAPPPLVEAPSIEAAASRPLRRVATVAVTSGKGGVGKSSLALNLAIALTEGAGRVCLLDANLGLGNIDLLCGLNGYWNLSHVVTGARSLAEVVLEGPAGIHVVPGASGLTEQADCPPPVRDEIFDQLSQLEADHDFLVIDTGTGIHRAVRHFAAAADTVLVVTTPEPTSITDAYATIKSLSTQPDPTLAVLVNQADSSEQARAIIERIRQTAQMFLHVDVESAGSVPHDPAVSRAVFRRMPFVLEHPHSPAAQAIRQLARRLRHSIESRPRSQAYFPRLRERTACLV